MASDQWQLLQLVPGTENSPDVIAVAGDSTDNSVWGLQVDDGSILWSCSGPIPRSDNVYQMLDRLAILGGDPNGPPLVAATYGFITSCRQAALTQVDSATGEMRVVDEPVRRPAIRRVTAGFDPRWQRDLPWRIDPHLAVSRFTEFLAWAAFFSGAMVLVPGGYLAWLILQRRFGVTTLLMLPAVAGLLMFAAMVEAPMDSDFSTWPSRMAVGATFAPALLGLVLLVRWVLTGRMRRTALWLVAWLVTAVVMGAISIWQYQRRGPLLPEESFDWSSWYQILLPAYYAMACLLLLVTSVEWLIRAWTSGRVSSRKVAAVPPESQPLTVAAHSASNSLGRRSGSQQR